MLFVIVMFTRYVLFAIVLVCFFIRGRSGSLVLLHGFITFMMILIIVIIIIIILITTTTTTTIIIITFIIIIIFISIIIVD